MNIFYTDIQDKPLSFYETERFYVGRNEYKNISYSFFHRNSMFWIELR